MNNINLVKKQTNTIPIRKLSLATENSNYLWAYLTDKSDIVSEKCKICNCDEEGWLNIKRNIQ